MVHAKLRSVACIKGFYQFHGPIWNYAAGTLAPLEGPGTLLKHIA